MQLVTINLISTCFLTKFVQFFIETTQWLFYYHVYKTLLTHQAPAV